jgi:Tfp pilus assembly protein PilO
VKIPRPLPKGAVIGGIVGIGLLVLAIGWFGVIAPENHKAASLDKQTAAIQTQITNNLAQIAASKNVQAAPKIKVADVYKLAKAMPSDGDMSSILLQISQIAKDSGVQLASIGPSQWALDPSSGQQTMQLSLSVTGDFYSLTDLLYRLRNTVDVRHGALDATGRLFTIGNVSFAPSGGRNLTATVTVNTYMYGGGTAAAAAPAPAPATTSTDTTSTDTTQSGSPSAAGSGGQ